MLRWFWSAHALGKDTAPTRGVSSSARGRGATYQLRPPRISGLLRGTRECATALAVSREEAQRASLLRARRASLIVVGSCTWQGHCTDKRPLSFGARPWCDIPAAASQNQPVLPWHMRARYCACCLSGGGAVRMLASRPRRAALVVVGRCTRQGHRTVKRPLSFGVRPWCDVPAAASQNQPAFAWHTRARHCACCFSGGGAARELVARAQCRAGCGRPIQ